MHPVILNEVIKPMEAKIGRYRMVSLTIIESTYFVINSSYRVRIEIAAGNGPFETRELSFEHASLVFNHFLPMLKN